MILKMTGLSPGFQCKSWFEKFALSPELLTNICKNNLCCQTQLSYFWTFCAISSGWLHAFQSQFSALRPLAQASCFEYYAPYKQRKVFFNY